MSHLSPYSEQPLVQLCPGGATIQPGPGVVVGDRVGDAVGAVVGDTVGAKVGGSFTM